MCDSSFRLAFDDDASTPSVVTPSMSTDSSTANSVATTPPCHDELPADKQETQPRKKRKPIPGKGFHKSRRGCFSCKRRRVKCSEARPECRGCNRLGLVCVYPESNSADPHKASPQYSASSSNPGVCLDHLRFFRHFLIEAHPSEPQGTKSVWYDVAALSHEVRSTSHDDCCPSQCLDVTQEIPWPTADLSESTSSSPTLYWVSQRSISRSSPTRTIPCRLSISESQLSTASTMHSRSHA